MDSRFDDFLIKPIWRLAVSSLMVFAMLWIYGFININQSLAPRPVQMPGWVQFRPEFIVPYIGLLFMTWLVPVAIRDPKLFLTCLRANIIAWLIVVPWWILTPTELARPPLPDGPWAGPFLFLWTCDLPYNVFPCAHAVGPLVVAWFAARDRPAWRWPLVVVLLVCLPSIALTWQHRPIDILLGTAAAVIGILISSRGSVLRLWFNRDG